MGFLGLGEKDKTKGKEDQYEGSETITRLVSIGMPIILIAMVMGGLVSGKYSIGIPKSSDLTWILITFIILSTCSSGLAIFTNTKKDSPFSKAYSFTFVLITLAAAFVRGLSVWTFLLPFLGVSILGNWVTNKLRVSHDIATKGGSQELTFKQLVKALGKGTQSFNEFKKGFKNMKKEIANLEEIKEKLKTDLIQEIDVPTGMKRVQLLDRLPPVHISNAKNSLDANTSIGKEMISSYMDYYRDLSQKLEDIPTDSPLTAIDSILFRTKKIAKKLDEDKGGVANYGKRTIDKFMDIVYDASELYKEAFPFVWEKYKVLMVKRAVVLENESTNKQEKKWIYERFKYHDRVRRTISEALEIVQDLLIEMKRQAEFLGVMDKTDVPETEVCMKDAIIDKKDKMKDILKEKNPTDPPPETLGGSGKKFSKVMKDAIQIVGKYSDYVKKMKVQKHSMNNPAHDECDWPLKLQMPVPVRKDRTIQKYE